MARVRRILVIDDEESSRQLLSDLLTGEGYQVVTVGTGEDGWKQLQAQRFDLAVVDRALPGMDGIQLLKQMCEARMKVPTLMVSAFGEEKLWAEAIGWGASDYLLKPFASDQVLKAVKKLLQT
ncbi:MAG: response regulator [Elusimicrobia bacterium]|nr:response regulator [Elusimicrobiota bacterium]